MKNKSIRNITLSAMFLALAIVFAFISGNIPEVGNTLCPMHIPVMLCGFILGWPYGLLVGFLAPFLKSFLTGVPYLYPTAISMAFELSTYGMICGFLYPLLKKKSKNNLISLITTLIISMLSGRLIWGVMRYFLIFFKDGQNFTFNMFLTGAFISAWPGIIIQLIMIPSVIYLLEKNQIIKK